MKRIRLIRGATSGLGLIVLVLALTLPATDLRAATGDGVADAISSFQQSLPSIFHELSAEDVGVKPRIRPHFDFTSSFSSDVNLGDSQDDPAWLARIASGVTLEYPIGPRLYTELDYTYSLGIISGRKTDDITNTHNVSGLARYDVTDQTAVGLSQNLQLTEVPGLSDKTFILSTSTAQVTQKVGDRVTVSVQDQFQHFSDRESVTPSTIFNDNGVSTTVAYDATDRITATPWFRWNIRDFEGGAPFNNKDYTNLSAGSGVSYKVGPGTSVSGRLGWNRRHFDRDIPFATIKQEDTENDLVWGVGVTNNIGHKLVWNIDYSSDIQDTFDTGFVNRENAEATNFDNFDRNFRMLRTNRVGANARYVIDERQSASLFGDYQHIGADKEHNVARGRDGKEQQMEIGASYDFRLNRYISFVLRYVFGRRFTVQDTGSGRDDYTFHKATGGLTVQI